MDYKNRNTTSPRCRHFEIQCFHLSRDNDRFMRTLDEIGQGLGVNTEDVVDEVRRLHSAKHKLFAMCEDLAEEVDNYRVMLDDEHGPFSPDMLSELLDKWNNLKEEMK